MQPVDVTSTLGILSYLKHVVTATHLHPILVNFTAALIPVSIAADFVGRFRKNESLRNTAWWTLLFATVITPFTAMTGWLFWMSDDNGVAGMAIHKWLGSGLAILLLGIFGWRFKLHQKQQWASMTYLITGLIFILLLVIQGHLGGAQAFSGM